MKYDNIYKEVEDFCKKEKIMENYYEVESFKEDEPYFTTSQETDIQEMISDGFEVDEIVSIIKQW